MSHAVRFTRSRDGTRIAWSVSGSGPVLAYLQIPSLSHLELYELQPGVSEFLSKLGRGRTLVRMDFRGTGMSERWCEDHSPDALTDDLEAVLNSAGTGLVDIYAAGARVSQAIRWALRHPDRVSSIVLASPFTARPVSHGRPGVPGFLELMESNYPLFIDMMAQRMTGRPLHDLGQLVQFMHRCADQRNQLAELRASRFEEDWELASSVHAPVLVIYQGDPSVVSTTQVHSFAARFPKGTFAVLPEGTGSPPIGNAQFLIQAIEEFLGPHETETRQSCSSDDGGLTAREQQVLQLLVSGRTELEVAEILVISPATVSRHVTHIYAKLGVHRRAEAVAWAARRGLLDAN